MKTTLRVKIVSLAALAALAVPLAASARPPQEGKRPLYHPPPRPERHERAYRPVPCVQPYPPAYVQYGHPPPAPAYYYGYFGGYYYPAPPPPPQPYFYYPRQPGFSVMLTF